MWIEFEEEQTASLYAALWATRVASEEGNPFYSLERTRGE